MSSTAVFLNKDGEQFTAELKQLEDNALEGNPLSEGEVLVRVEHSGINYKDGLAIANRSPVVRGWPMVAGVDGAGTVVLVRPKMEGRRPRSRHWMGPRKDPLGLPCPARQAQRRLARRAAGLFQHLGRHVRRYGRFHGHAQSRRACLGKLRQQPTVSDSLSLERRNSGGDEWTIGCLALDSRLRANGIIRPPAPKGSGGFVFVARRHGREFPSTPSLPDIFFLTFSQAMNRHETWATYLRRSHASIAAAPANLVC